MSDSESDILDWRKTDQTRGNSLTKPISKRSYISDTLMEEPLLKRQKSNHSIKNKTDDNDQLTNVITQPPMLLFKHFLNQQDDNILVEDAMRKYNEYKESFACEQLQSFFEAHKDEEWFMEKYHPDYTNTKETKRLESVENRRKAFMWLYEHNYLHDVSVHINCQDALVKLFDSLSILLEGGNENDLKVLEKRVYNYESPQRTEIKINMKNDMNGLNWDDFHTSSPDDSDVEIISDKTETNQIFSKDNEKRKRKSTKNILKKELTPEPEPVEECMNDDLLTEDCIDPRPLHKTCSIFLRNIHPSVFRSQIEELAKPFPGYLRMALQDPMPERNFLRRGWITFERSSDINNIVWQLNKAPLMDIDLGAVINKEIVQRIRPIDPVTNHRAVMRQDVKYAAKLVVRFDKRRHLWEPSSSGTEDQRAIPLDDVNPLLLNITEHLVDEGSYEEEAYLGGDISNNLAITGGSDPSNIRLDEDHELSQVLDRLVLYLRIVHSYDYYSNTEYDIEDQLPNRCGLVHARGNLMYPDQRLSQAQLENYMKCFETKTELVLDSIDNLDFEVATRLGVRNIDEAVEKFITDNTKEISSEKWLCPLSGKKFKGPEYVRKHIFNKYNDRVDNVKQTVQFFNNYILDPRRPQLPEHHSNRPNQNQCRIYKSDKSFDQGHSIDSLTFSRNMRKENSYRKDDGRADFGNRNMKTGRSYYSRKILNYNDISVVD